MNKKKCIFIMFIIIFIILNYIIYSSFFKKTNYITDHEYLYDIAIEYLKNNDEIYNHYLQNEEDCQMIISYDGFEIAQDKEYKYAYMWIIEEIYYVSAGKLYRDTGSSMAYKFTFKNNEVVEYEIPRDGSEYCPSIKKMFPKDISSRVLEYDSTQLVKEQSQKVEEHYSYLESTAINFKKLTK